MGMPGFCAEVFTMLAATKRSTGATHGQVPAVQHLVVHLDTGHVLIAQTKEFEGNQMVLGAKLYPSRGSQDLLGETTADETERVASRNPHESELRTTDCVGSIFIPVAAMLQWQRHHFAY